MVTVTTMEWIAVAVMSIALLFGSFGNAFAIFVFGYKKRIRSNYETLLLTLALIHLFCSFFVPSFFIYETLTKCGQWNFAETQYKIFSSILQIGITVSQGILIMLSLERYWASIVNPTHRQVRTSKRLYIYLCIVFIVAMILAALNIYSLGIKKWRNSSVNNCFRHYENKIYHKVNLSSSIIDLVKNVTTLFVVVILNNRMSKVNGSSCDQFNSNRDIHRIFVSCTNVRKTVIAMVAALSILAMPADLLKFAISLCQLIVTSVIKSSTYTVVAQCSMILLALQAASFFTNVIIYASLNPEFEKFVKCLRCCCKIQIHRSKDGINISTVQMKSISVIGNRYVYN